MLRRLVFLIVITLLPSWHSVGFEEWRTVKSWAGEGMKETDTFVVKSRKWRIKWKTHGEKFEGGSILQIYVHKEDGTMVTLAANKQGEGEDVSYVRSGPGEHYLVISSANVRWNVEVQDQR